MKDNSMLVAWLDCVKTYFVYEQQVKRLIESMEEFLLLYAITKKKSWHDAYVTSKHLLSEIHAAEKKKLLTYKKN